MFSKNHRLKRLATVEKSLLFPVISFFHVQNHFQIPLETSLAPFHLLLMAEILHQLRLVVYPIIYEVSYIPGG